MKDFLLQANGLATEQIYQTLSLGKTRLSFTLFFKEGAKPSVTDLLKTYLAAYKVKNVTRKI